MVGENADRPAAALPDNNSGRTHAPFPGAEQLIGCGRQQKDWPHSQGKAIERSLWRKIESLRRVAQTGLRAGAAEEAVLAEHYGKYCSRDHIPVCIERNRHYRLDVHKPLGTISLRTDFPVVVSEEWHADEGGERIGELFGQSFAVILRKRSSSPQKTAATEGAKRWVVAPDVVADLAIHTRRDRCRADRAVVEGSR